MRRSSAVKLTLLPMLASAAVAAQPAPRDEPPLQPPGATAPMLSPPGLTPAIDPCQVDPDGPGCPPVAVYRGFVHGGAPRPCVFRGGFGHYAWAAGG